MQMHDSLLSENQIGPIKHRGTTRLQTSRLVLRRAEKNDADPMFRNWASDSAVTKFLTWQAYDSVRKVERFIGHQLDNYKRNDFYDWFIECKAVNEAIGSIGFVNCDESTGSFEVGYVIGRAWWGLGIASEALSAVMEYAFRQLGANRIYAQHDTSNPRSGRVLAKCGMTCEGVSRQAMKGNNGIVDVCRYSILAKEYFDSTTPLGITVRAAQMNDFEFVRTLRQRTHDRHVWAEPKRFIDEDIYSESSFGIDCEEGSLIIAVADERPIGYCKRTAVTTKRYPGLKAQSIMRINELAVQRDWRRRGVGTALFNDCVQTARKSGCEALELNVWSFNESARMFYEHMGMRQTFVPLVLELT